MKIKKLLILISFVTFFGATSATACTNGNPCVGGSGNTTPNQTSQAQQGQSALTPTVYQPTLPQIYSNSGDTSINTQVAQNTPVNISPSRVSPPDYSYISPIIFNQNGSVTRQLDGSTSGGTTQTTTTNNSNSNQNESSSGGILDGIFGGSKIFSGSNSNPSIDQNLRATVESKGLAMGGNNLTCTDGKNADYVVLYKNITGEPLTNVAIRISLPDNVVPTKTNVGSYSERDNTITVFIGALSKGQEGQIVINGEYTSSKGSGNIARSEMVYTLPNQNQNMIVAYAFGGQNCTESNNALGASAIGSNFFGGTLLGWIFLALFISALIYLIRFFLRTKDPHTLQAHGH